MRRTTVAVAATACAVIGALSVPMTAIAYEAAPVSGDVVTEDDPVDPVAPTPAQPPTEPGNPGPTPPSDSGGDDGADPVTPTPAPPAGEPTDTEGSVSAPITNEDDQEVNTDQDGTGDQPPTTDTDQVDNGVAVPPVIVPEVVSPVPQGAFEPGDTAPEGHVFVAPDPLGGFQVVPTYRQGVSLAKTGAALPYLIGMSAALAGAGAVLVRKRTRQ